MDDVNVFFKENVKHLLEVVGGQEMGMMFSGMGTEPIMTFIHKCYRQYQEEK